jgi:hypothetical protein
MERRTVLAAAGGSLGVLAGCVSLDIRGASPVTLQRRRYLAGAAEATQLREDRPAEIPTESAIPDALLGPLRQARDGRYVTDAVSDPLLNAIDEFRDPKDNYRLESPYVRIDGTTYVFDARVPTLLVVVSDETVESVDRDAVFERDRLHAEENGLAAETASVVDRLTYRGPNAPRLPYRASSVPAPLRDFLDSYDYIEDSQGVSPIVTERQNRDPPYVIEVREPTASDRFGRPVVDSTTLDAGVQDFVRAVVESDWARTTGRYVTDSVPDGYFEALQPTGDYRTDPFVLLGDSVYYIAVTEGEHDRLPVDAAVGSLPPEDGVGPRFELTVTATADGSQSAAPVGNSIDLFSHVGLPSVLWVEAADELHLLRSDAYRYTVVSNQRERTSTAAGLFLTVDEYDVAVLTAERETAAVEWSLDVDVEAVRQTTVVETVSLGSQVSAVYEVPDTVPPGTYTAPGFFGVRWDGDPEDRSRESIYPFAVEVTVENR